MGSSAFYCIHLGEKSQTDLLVTACCIHYRSDFKNNSFAKKKNKKKQKKNTFLCRMQYSFLLHSVGVELPWESSATAAVKTITSIWNIIRIPSPLHNTAYKQSIHKWKQTVKWHY